MKETLVYMWRNKKNRLVMIVCLGALLLHSLIILPNTPGYDEVDIVQLEREMDSNRQTFEDRLDTGQTLPSFMTGTSAYEVARNNYVNQRELLVALRTGDARRYLQIPYRPVVENPEETESSFSVLGREKEEFYQRGKTTYYINEVDPLSFHVIAERTSVQQAHLFLIGQGPFILIFLLLFMISDVVTKDRKLSTQKAGVPLNWFSYLFYQSITAVGFFVVFLAGLAGIFYLGNGLLHGFGSLSLPVGFFEAALPDEGFINSLYDVMPVGRFFLKMLPYLLLLLYGFTRINTLFSLLFKQDVVVLIASVFLLLFPQLYYGAGTTELLGIDLTFYPQTYYQFGDVATGRLAEAFRMYIPEYRGIIVLIVTIFIIEGLNFLAAKAITRQQFIR